MKMNFDGTITMPVNYAVMNEDEMSYLEGGATAVVTGTASNIRARLTTIIGCSFAGIGTSAALGACLGGPVGAAVTGLVGGVWFQSYIARASSAHNQVENIINTSKKGKSTQCRMTTTYSFAGYCTGISVEAV